MRVVLQRVSRASVEVSGEAVGRIGMGLCLLVGIDASDTDSDVEAAVDKIVGLRVFPDAEGKMNLSLSDVGGEVLVVSQFTLLGEVRRGRRPSFTSAAPSDRAAALIGQMVGAFRARDIGTAEGRFGEKQSVDLVNEGPVTLVVETRNGSVV